MEELNQFLNANLSLILLNVVPFLTLIVLLLPVRNQESGRLKWRFFVSAVAVCTWAYVYFSMRQAVGGHSGEIEEAVVHGVDEDNVSLLFGMAGMAVVSMIVGGAATLALLWTFRSFRTLTIIAIVFFIVGFPVALVLSLAGAFLLLFLGFLLSLAIYIITLLQLLSGVRFPSSCGASKATGKKSGTDSDKGPQFILPGPRSPDMPKEEPVRRQPPEKREEEPVPPVPPAPSPKPGREEREKKETESILVLRLSGDLGDQLVYPDQSPYKVSRALYVRIASDGEGSDLFQFDIVTTKQGRGAVWMLVPCPGRSNRIMVDGRPVTGQCFLKTGQVIALCRMENGNEREKMEEELFAHLSVSFKIQQRSRPVQENNARRTRRVQQHFPA